MSAALLFEIIAFALTLWLGLYLLNRNFTNPRLRFAGAGAVAYAFALCADVLAGQADPAASNLFIRLRSSLIVLPAVCWGITLFYVWQARRAAQPKGTFNLIALATLFFALGLGLLSLPFNWLPREWLLPSIGLDFAMLGFAIAALDAFDEGEAFAPDMARSFNATALSVFVFGGLVLLFGVGPGLTGLAFLLAIITAAIVTQVFSDAIQNLVDRLSFARRPTLYRARADLRAATRAVPRINDALDLHSLGDDEFARLTRRAISHMGDLSRLAASPLTRLSIVEARLTARGLRADSLERANELRALLTESILRLKPRGKGEFGTADEWRHYNALYFPYVVGLKPYSLRAEPNGFDDASRAALDWFRTSVPERTLYNWQNAAAKLVAHDLREKTTTTGSDWQ